MSVEIGGIGQSVKRKEDARFIRGKGKYVDDVKLPGMLYLDIARSPYAHARIKSIDTSKALKIPGVAAVITGKDLVPLKLEWMPTLMSDKQMVLPTDTVLYQAQQVAAVVAAQRYITAGSSRGTWASPSTRSESSRRTLAVASAGRCRSTLASSSRSVPRSSREPR